MVKGKKAMLNELRQMYAVEEKKSSFDKKKLARLKEKMHRVKTSNLVGSLNRDIQ